MLISPYKNKLTKSQIKTHLPQKTTIYLYSKQKTIRWHVNNISTLKSKSTTLSLSNSTNRYIHHQHLLDYHKYIIILFEKYDIEIISFLIITSIRVNSYIFVFINNIIFIINHYFLK